MSEPGRCDTGDTAVDVEGLVGRRVVVRHRVGDKLTDAVGDLSADGAELVVQTRRGPVRVARAAVTAVRAIPPAPPRRASLSAIARLEELCADAWPALVDERLGAWRLRAADGFTGRANAALAIGSPGMPVAAALEVVRTFAEQHGITPRVQVPVGSPWDRAVARQGWVLDVGHAAGALVSVQVADLTRVPDGPAGRGGPAYRRLVAAGVGPPAHSRPTARPRPGRPRGRARKRVLWHSFPRTGLVAGGRAGGEPLRTTCTCRCSPSSPPSGGRGTARRCCAPPRPGDASAAPGGACCRWPCTTARPSPSTPGRGGPSTTATATWCRPA